MRISDTAVIRNFLESLRRARADTTRALDAISDGKRVRVASDDPSGSQTAIELRGRLVRTEGYLRSGAAARLDLETIDAALSQVNDILIDVRSKALQGASGTYDQAGGVLATEVDQLRAEILTLANTQQDGRYLFAGTETLTTAFDSAGVYGGNVDLREAPLDSGSTVAVTLDGADVFQGAGDLFATLSDLSTALAANDSATIQTALQELQSEMDRIAEVRTRVGTRLQSIERVGQRLKDEQVLLQRRVIEIEGADLSDLAVELSSASTRAEALGAAGARVLGRSLFDYLG